MFRLTKSLRFSSQGANILLGLADSSVISDVLNTSTLEDVDSYIIDESLSAFRHWATPVSNNGLANIEFVQDDCFTSMSFTTKYIGGIELNITNGGLNNLIWGMDASDYLVGYHEFRGHLSDFSFNASGSAQVLPPTSMPTVMPTAATTVSGDDSAGDDAAGDDAAGVGVSAASSTGPSGLLVALGLILVARLM